MHIFKDVEPLKSFLKDKRLKGNTIGLVPTMGALHDGHLALLRSSKQQNSVTVCSIYINPTQFNNASDLEKYPRTLDSDISLLENASCDVLFCPDNHTMYEEKSIVQFDFGYLDKVMEGSFRPGHFSGVALVVSKLFNIVLPDNAYFGQKDWQQYTIIRQLVKELKFGFNLHAVTTTRESDGLALSSRNKRLEGAQRQKAIVFYEGLITAKALLIDREPLSEVKATVKRIVEKHPETRLEYIELVDSQNLKGIYNVDEADQPILCIAGYVDEVRLIDNMFL
jgi:pantoate--beta-alanine ligase